MDLGNIGNKLLSGVDNNATLIGAGLGLAKSWWGAQDSLQQLLGFGKMHGPDLGHISDEIRNDPSYRTALFAIIGGTIAQESGISIVDRTGKIVAKAATGFLLVRLAENVLWSMTHSAGAGGSSGGNSSPTGNRGYS